jgi:FixJ family two-component response regulator
MRFEDVRWVQVQSHPSQGRPNTGATTTVNSRSTESSSTPIVSVVDADPAVREVLDSMIRAAGWEPRMFASARQFLDCPRHLTPGCVIVEVTLPDFSGLELQKLIADRPEMPIIFIASRDDVRTTVQAMKAGAHEFLTKPFSVDVMLSSIVSALERSRVGLGFAVAHQVLCARYASLTTRQRQVLNLVIRGQLNKVTAYKLGISEITVKGHRRHVMRKMKAASLPDLVNIAARLFLTPDPLDGPDIERLPMTHSGRRGSEQSADGSRYGSRVRAVAGEVGLLNNMAANTG